MLCSSECPRGRKDCHPLSNIVTTDKKDLVCVGNNSTESRSYKQDKFRHCFKSEGGTDSMYDYDAYDLKSVIAVMSEALLLEEITAIK